MWCCTKIPLMLWSSSFTSELVRLHYFMFNPLHKRKVKHLNWICSQEFRVGELCIFKRLPTISQKNREAENWEILTLYSFLMCHTIRNISNLYKKKRSIATFLAYGEKKSKSLPTWIMQKCRYWMPKAVTSSRTLKSRQLRHQILHGKDQR